MIGCFYEPTRSGIQLNCVSSMKLDTLFHVTAFNYISQRYMSVRSSSGVGVTRDPFVYFSISKMFDLAKVPVRLSELHLYLTGVPANQLRQHLSNINMIFTASVCFHDPKNEENNEMEEIGLVTPTPGWYERIIHCLLLKSRAVGCSYRYRHTTYRRHQNQAIEKAMKA